MVMILPLRVRIAAIELVELFRAEPRIVLIRQRHPVMLTENAEKVNDYL